MSSRRTSSSPPFDINLLTELLERFEAAEPRHEVAIQAVRELLAEAVAHQHDVALARSNGHRN
jgi:DNA-binding transcriptional LysR family regulator